MKPFIKSKFRWIVLILVMLEPAITSAQVIKLQDAIQIALAHYKIIGARKNYAEASLSAVAAAKAQFLPDLSAGAQIAYGTANGINGPGYGLSGIGTISGGTALPAQNWNAAFGSLYVASVNWQFFSFGNLKSNVKASEQQYQNNLDAVDQESFQLKTNVSGAYLNVLAAQRLLLSMQKNLERAAALRDLILVRSINGLNPGVDSTIANAELSKARLSELDAQNYEQEQESRMKVLLGVHQPLIYLDTSFVSTMPNDLGLNEQPLEVQHPVLKYLASKVAVSRLQADAISTSKWPKFSLFSLYQGRGSGFGSNYPLGTNGDINHSFPAALDPARKNYMLGVSAAWNITDILRIKKKVNEQDLLTAAYRDEYDVQKNTFIEQQFLADQKIQIALKQYNEAPVQLKSAAEAYTQKTALYQNGLATIVDVTQALYDLNRAETDADLAYNNLWQALLYKATTAGDISLFLNQIQ